MGRFTRLALYLLAVLTVSTLAFAQVQPSAQERETFRRTMAAIPLPSRGCFIAHYPNAVWQQDTCGPAPTTVNPVARGVRPNYVGDGNDYFISVTGTITSATGSFNSVSGAAQEYGPRLGNTAVVYPDTYSLQLNANTFDTSVCGGISGCLGWEQFLFSQSQCNPVPSACIFIEYWLLNHPSPCPSSAWNYYPGTTGTVPGCYINTAFAAVPVQPLSDLSQLSLNGSVSNGADIVTLVVPTGDIHSSSQDSLLNLAQGWTGAEYNLVGDCCATEAYFTSPTNISVQLSAINGTSNVPTCTTTFSGATAEDNNLNFTSGCSASGGASPAIVFSEGGGSPLPPGVSIGDTHLTTFWGIHYDFQPSGEFVLVQAGTDFIVQTRQKLWSTPTVAVNTGVATKIGGNRVALCLSGLEVNGRPTPIGDGQQIPLPNGVTVLRKGNNYSISGSGGSNIQAQMYGDHIDVSVGLGAVNPGDVRGLLGGDRESHNLIMRDGTILRAPIAADVWRRYADSWRVAPADSMLCRGGQVHGQMPAKFVSVEDLTPQQREHASSVCARAGVPNGPTFNDCILDVTLLQEDSAADGFVHTPQVKTVVRPGP